MLGSKGINQHTLENIDSDSLMVLHGELLHEYEHMLFQKETFWFQKSREKQFFLSCPNDYPTKDK